jgi:hypothetical protein
MELAIHRFFASWRSHRASILSAALLVASCIQPQPVGPAAYSADPRVELGQLRNPAAPFGVSVVQDGPATIVAGQSVRVLVSATAPGFASLWHIGSAGEVEQLFAGVPITAGQTVSFPLPGAPYLARYSGPPGFDTFVGVVSATPLTAFGPSPYPGGGGVVRLAETPGRFVSRLLVQLQTLPANSWNTATATVAVQS